ncbi:MAG: hypothetical protein ACRCYZ_06390 [Alphaproteobacteria bacterium]
MKQILVWPGGVLVLASIFSTAAQAGVGSVGVNQGKKITSTAGERRASEPPSYAVPLSQGPVAKKILSEEEKLKILHQDSIAYVSTQGGKRFKEADWVSWFMKRYGKDEAFAKTWLAKLKVYDAKLKAAKPVPQPQAPTVTVKPPPTVAPPPPLPTRPVTPPLPATPSLPPPLTNVPPMSSFPKPPTVAPPPPLPTVAPPPTPPRNAAPAKPSSPGSAVRPTDVKLKPTTDRKMPAPKPTEKTPAEILSEQMDARRKAIDGANKDVGESESSEEWD